MPALQLAPPASEGVQTCARHSEALGLWIEVVLEGDRVQRVSLRRRPSANAARADHPVLARLAALAATGRGDLRDVPVDLAVGPFARRVLEALRDVPPGEVVTYGELARRLGKPGAARAVGNACAANPAPILVPCHRVVPADGRIGAYSGEGGPETKRRLLAREGAWPLRGER